jgi:hypothetical protein
MFTSFAEFIKCVVEARFGFKYLYDVIIGLYYSITQNPDITVIWEKLMGLISGARPYIPFLAILLGVIICLFGKKMAGVLKFVGIFIVGFALGVYFLGPVIPAEVPIPVWIIGLVVGIVSAVLSKFIFVAAYSVAVLYSVYRLCYYGFFLDTDAVFTVGKSVSSLAVAAIVLVLSLILFKFMEMLISSALGAWIATMGFSAGIFDLGAIAAFGDKAWIFELVVVGLITLLGFVFQIRTRRRY